MGNSISSNVSTNGSSEIRKICTLKDQAVTS